MGTLYLVRHGQASFGADDYDNLSELGRRQSVRLGQYWRAHGLAFDAVLTGTLRRHAQTWAGIAKGLGLPAAENAMSTAGPPQGAPAASLGTAMSWPGLNEYDSAAVLHAIHPQALPRPDTPELYRQHFRLLREGLRQWMSGTTRPQGMPSYAEFLAGVTGALDYVRENCAGNVLIVSSGGPISTAVGHVLGTAAQTTIELNLRIRNSAVTEFVFTPKRHTLLSYNTLPHLDGPEHAGWITYS